MKVLMFGWEFPPHILGGLGTASYGLSQLRTYQRFSATRGHADYLLHTEAMGR